MFNGQSLVGGVGARDLEQKQGEEGKCIAKRYAEVVAVEEGEGATGAWHLPGSLENHKRYSNTVQDNPGKSNAEIVALAGGVYHKDCKLGVPGDVISRKDITNTS